MKGIYRFAQDCGRSGDLSGVFTADAETVERLMGETVSFGEVLGKHSDVDVDIDPSNLSLVSADPASVAMFERLDLATGHNPFDYFEEEEDEEESEED